MAMGPSGVFLLLGLLLLPVEEIAAAAKNRCTLPPNHGPCKRKQQRYYYHQTQKKCSVFTYGGCGGNANRFLTLRHCEKACVKKVTPRFCQLPALRGPCKKQLPRVFFEWRTKRCKPFVYGGCKGNANRFKTEQQCKKACQPSTKGK